MPMVVMITVNQFENLVTPVLQLIIYCYRIFITIGLERKLTKKSGVYKVSNCAKHRSRHVNTFLGDFLAT